MAARRDGHEGDRFRVRPAAPKARYGLRSQRFVSQVLKEVSRAGAKASGGLGARPASSFGRGRVAAGMAGRGLCARARRVVIKSRFVVLRKAGARSVVTHLRYLERDGTTRDGQRGQAYGPDTDAADLASFEARGRGDRHQFRFIVSLEDAAELEDLRDYTRTLMDRMAIDLETRLDWVAVDHWDTDNPHTHVVLRGRAGDGKGSDLVIAPDYMAHGMRLRASELATEWLGPRTELEMRRSLLREVDQERLTSLDRVLQRQAVAGLVDLGRPMDRQDRTDHRQAALRARLQRLQAMSLAERVDSGRWRLALGLQQTLTRLGERGDILRAMHKAMKGTPRELAMDELSETAVVGRIVDKGIADELTGQGYLVIDGVDGRAHYRRLPVRAELAAFPIESVVEVRPVSVEQAKGVIQKEFSFEVHSPSPIHQQMHALGATWLDRQLVARDIGLAGHGFGAQVVEAMRVRAEFLVEQGLATRRGGRIELTRDLLIAMRDRELAAVGKSLQQQIGLPYRPLKDGGAASGVYRRHLQLVSGRFALLESGPSFTLVPWRPVIEGREGRHISALIRGQSVTWQIGRQRGMSV